MQLLTVVGAGAGAEAGADSTASKDVESRSGVGVATASRVGVVVSGDVGYQYIYIITKHNEQNKTKLRICNSLPWWGRLLSLYRPSGTARHPTF